MQISKKISICLLCIALNILQVKAQLTISGQLRTRTELRDRVGTLRLKGANASCFTSQRSRVSFNYKMSKVNFQTTLQDVRVWGQDASTINSADGSRLGVHEAWAEIELASKRDSSIENRLTEYFAIKIGRQELVYDDSRLMGNLDWLQQTRRQDAIVFKLLKKSWQLDLGLAFNQNTDAFNYSGTFYTPANVLPYVKDSKGNLGITPAAFIPLTNSDGLSSKTGAPALQAMPSSNGLYQNYKSLEYSYISKSFNRTKVSALVVADHFGKYITDSFRNISGEDTGYIYGKHFNRRGVNSRVTAGIYLTTFLGEEKAIGITAALLFGWIFFTNPTISAQKK